MQKLLKLTPSCCNSLKKDSGLRSVCNMQIYRGFCGLSWVFFLLSFFFLCFVFFFCWIRCIYLRVAKFSPQINPNAVAQLLQLHSRWCCKMQHAACHTPKQGLKGALKGCPSSNNNNNNNNNVTHIFEMKSFWPIKQPTVANQLWFFSPSSCVVNCCSLLLLFLWHHQWPQSVYIPPPAAPPPCLLPSYGHSLKNPIPRPKKPQTHFRFVSYLSLFFFSAILQSKSQKKKSTTKGNTYKKMLLKSQNNNKNVIIQANKSSNNCYTKRLKETGQEHSGRGTLIKITLSLLKVSCVFWFCTDKKSVAYLVGILIRKHFQALHFVLEKCSF